MKDIGIVMGNSEQAQPLVIGKDKVYIHTDITPVTEDARGNKVDDLFQYHEVQYDKDEYIKLIAEQNAALETQLTDTQIGLTEVYEMML